MTDRPQQQIEAAFDPSGVIAPDTLLAQAAERIQLVQEAFAGATGNLEDDRVGEVQTHLATVARRLGQAASALASARSVKDELLADLPTANEPSQQLVLLSGQEPGQEVARPEEAVEIPPENRGWEDSRLLMSAHELVDRLHNVNFHPYGSLEATGIRQLRDVYMAPGRLAAEGVIAPQDTGRLIRELYEAYPDLPQLEQFGDPDPVVAAFLYETVQEVPADLVMAKHVQSILGHAVLKGKRVTMGDFLELLQARTGLLEPLPKDLMASMDAMQEANRRTGRTMRPAESRAITDVYTFITKFQEARRAGRRPPRADSNPWNQLR